MNKKLVFFSLIAASLFFTVQANALIIDGGIYGEVIAAPASVTDATVTNDHQQGFDEVQNYTLDNDLAVDGDGLIASGTIISSHMIFLNKAVGADNIYQETVWTFDGLILGVMSDSAGTLEAASTEDLGNGTTAYPDYTVAFPARGLEGNPLDGLTNDDWYTISGSTLDLYMQVSQPGDWIRVVTAAAPVPEPATFILLGSGLAGLAFYRKQRK